MNELKFLMNTRFIGRYEEPIIEFMNVIQQYVEKTHNAEFTGVSSFEYGGVILSWRRTTGCRGCYKTTFDTGFVSYSTLLTFLQQGDLK